jgi:hypothetical protein
LGNRDDIGAKNGRSGGDYPRSIEPAYGAVSALRSTVFYERAL